MKKILITLSLVGLTYQSQAQSDKLFEICYYPKPNAFENGEFQFVLCMAIVPIEDDSAKTMNDWFNSDEHKRYSKNSSEIILTYCPNKYSLPTKKYQIK